jgi:probable rRNA maturation factor
MLAVIVNIFNQQTTLKISLEQVQHAVLEVIRNEGQVCDEVSLYFVDAAAISQLHDQYFNDPSATDCISFPMDSDQDPSSYRILGEAFICTKTALEYAAKHKADPYKETTLYIVHCLLHLMGYDDVNEEDRNLMRRAEKRHMQNLKKLNLQLHL